MKQKRYGILLPISALPSDFGIGDLGPASYSFINWLKDAKASYWQVLPTTIADPKTGCPYSSMSAFGGYPDLISLEKLFEMNLLTLEDFSSKRCSIGKVDYFKTHQIKDEALNKAFINFEKLDDQSPEKKSLKIFQEQNSSWCIDLAHFLDLSNRLNNTWWLWDEDYKNYDRYIKSCDDIGLGFRYQLFIQFIFHKQWQELKDYANKNGISLIGDIPIFLSHHSMDVWRSPDSFKLNNDLTLKIQTGVPPDVFTEDGQIWSTPNYNWDKMQDDNFSWWKERIAYSLMSFDIIRFDHFIGLINVFEIPATDTHAKNGNWVKSPGRELLSELKSTFKELPMIVEDLGEKCPEVDQLKNEFSLPGMKILMFAYSSDDTNEHLPSFYQENEVVYTGTHDNNTLIGYFQNDASAKEIANVKQTLNISTLDNIHWKLIEECFFSRANMAIIPLQDFMGLASDCRFNIPGTVEGNWQWRFSFEDIPKGLSLKMANLAISAKRTS